MAEVVIVGGGPVGLYLAALLLQEGVEVKVLEQRLHRETHSRAIGVHPPALAALDAAGVAEAMVDSGVQIRRGIAMSRGRTVGSMSFAPVSKRFPFILSLPQSITGALLEQRVQDLDGSAMVRGARVTGVADDGDAVTLAVQRTSCSSADEGRTTHITAGLVVAADGSRSVIRRLLAVPASSRTYPDHYLMGDFADTGEPLQEAVLYLEAAGIVESFPLPGGVRRWVARVRQPAQAADAGDLARLVQQRTGVQLDPATNTMLSAFSPRATLATTSFAGRVVLVGDAAHEISPIGGQGMNLGWLDARMLAPIICEAVAGKAVRRKLEEYAAARRKAARLARWQSEVNMTLGRPLPRPLLAVRNGALGMAAGIPPVNRLVARRFTMQ